MPPKRSKNKLKKDTPKLAENPGFLTSHLARDVWGVFLISLFALIFLSLQSYQSHALAVQTGKVGRIISTFLIDGVGVGSYLLSFLVLLSGINSLRSLPKKSDIEKDIGYAVLLIAFCAFVSLFYSPSESLATFQKVKLGGDLGEILVNGFLLPSLGKNGSYIVIFTLFVISIRLMISQPFHMLWRKFVLRTFGRSEQVKAKRKTIRKTPIIEDDTPFSESLFPEPVIESKAVKKEAKKKKEPTVEDTEKKPKKTKKSKKKSEKKAHAEESNFIPKTVIGAEENYAYPSPDILSVPVSENTGQAKQEMIENSEALLQKLLDFDITGKITKVHPGPVITRYEFEPSAGIKVNKIANLSDDIAMAMRAMSIRIIAPIPGKSTVGIEIPNEEREIIYLKDILNSKEFARSRSKLTVALGKDIAGRPFVADLAKMPHLLVAGATGTGKSVTLNTLICSMLFNANPYELRLVMVDPKMLELGIYQGIPHLLAPVVTDPKKASMVLKWAVREMESRYKLLSEKKVRNIVQFNHLMLKETPEKRESEPLPYIVLVIDEYADLMMTSSKDVETSIIRLAQMARAVGIHLIIATQRPSVDVITGLIKANFPSRISFRVSSKTDSRTILDSNGAEKLLGMGDMLFLAPATSTTERIHGAMVTEEEVIELVSFLSGQKAPEFNEDIMMDVSSEGDGALENVEDEDPFFVDAVELVRKTGQASASMIQRRFRVGYNRAARMVEQMEKKGIVGPADGGKPRKVIYKN